MNSIFKQNDIMISYSTKRKEVAIDLHDILVESGYNVWMAPFSIPNGTDYIDEIYSAIDNSKMVLFVMCEESLSSECCQDELIYSIKQNKKILPVQISRIENPYDKLSEINSGLRRKQILELFPSYKMKIDEVFSSIETLMKNNKENSKPYPQNSNNYSDMEIIGRNEEIVEIHNLLKQYNIVNLYGMGGIGKTSLAMKYFSYYSVKGLYQSIHIAKYIDSIKNTIANIPFVGFDQEAYLDSIKDTNAIKEDVLFEKKIAMLNEHANDVLLVIDGVDYVEQAEVDLLTNLSCQVLLISRNKYNNVMSYEVKALTNQQLIELYSSITKTELFDEEIVALEDIIAEVGAHTLTIKLIASYAFDIGLGPIELKEEGILTNLCDFDSDEEKISTLLDKCEFTEKEIYALQVLALFPQGISKGKFQKVDRPTLRAYPNLVKKGWVVTDDVSYQLHQIVRELIVKKYPITTTNLKPFLSSFIEVFRHIGIEGNDLRIVMKQIDNIVNGNDYLMGRIYHLFGNAFCDMGYSEFFHVSKATYMNQDMNFYNKKNETKANFADFLYSLELNKKALNVVMKLSDINERKILPYIYSYLGSTNFNMNNYTEALKYQQLALTAAKELLEVTDHDYLVILNRLGLTAIEVGEYDVALNAFREYEKIGLENNLDLNYSMVKFNIGNVLYYTKQYDAAIKYYLESVKLNKDDLNTSFGYSELCLTLALIYKEKNIKSEVKKYYEIAKQVKTNIIIDEDILNNFIKKYDEFFNIN